RVDLDVVLHQLERERFGKPDQGGLGHRVGRVPGKRRRRPPTRHVDDLSPSLSDQNRDDGAADEKRTNEIRRQRVAPLGGIDLPCGTDWPENPRIVDKDVDPRESLKRGPHELSDVALAPNVSLDWKQCGTDPRQFVGRGLQVFPVPRTEGNVRALLEEPPDNGLPDTLAPTRT